MAETESPTSSLNDEGDNQHYLLHHLHGVNIQSEDQHQPKATDLNERHVLAFVLLHIKKTILQTLLIATTLENSHEVKKWFVFQPMQK